MFLRLTGARPQTARVTAFAAQTRVELALTLRRGESLLLTLGIPVLLLVFFSLVDVLPHRHATNPSTSSPPACSPWP